jgi:excisionase family DNA binding protein
MKPSPQLLTEKEAALYIGMSRSFLARARMIGDKNAPAFFKLGRSVRYRVAELDAWLEGRMRNSTNLINE